MPARRAASLPHPLRGDLDLRPTLALVVIAAGLVGAAFTGPGHAALVHLRQGERLPRQRLDRVAVQRGDAAHGRGRRGHGTDPAIRAPTARPTREPQ